MHEVDRQHVLLVSTSFKRRCEPRIRSLSIHIRHLTIPIEITDFDKNLAGFLGSVMFARDLRGSFDKSLQFLATHSNPLLNFKDEQSLALDNSVSQFQ